MHQIQIVKSPNWNVNLEVAILIFREQNYSKITKLECK